MPTPRFTAKIESEAPTPRLAVLIDADNTQTAIIENLLLEIAGFGEATVKRIVVRLKEVGLKVYGFGETKINVLNIRRCFQCSFLSQSWPSPLA